MAPCTVTDAPVKHLGYVRNQTCVVLVLAILSQELIQPSFLKAVLNKFKFNHMGLLLHFTDFSGNFGYRRSITSML